MDSAVFSTAPSGCVAVVVAVLTAGSTYFLTRKREREADWRKMKLDYYKEFVAAFSGIVEGRMTPESEVRYHDAFNSIGMVASPAVLSAVQELQAQISPTNFARTRESHDRKYSEMMNALRQDLQPRGQREANALNFYVISTRPAPSSVISTSK